MPFFSVIPKSFIKKETKSYRKSKEKAKRHSFNVIHFPSGNQSFKKRNDTMNSTIKTTISNLSPSGLTNTNEQLHAFSSRVVAKVKETFQHETIHCHLWGFRHDKYQMLSCDFFNENKSMSIPIIITACQEQDLDILDEPYVYDMVEALHLASLITLGLNATVKIGRHNNEINALLLAHPLNGKINLP